MRKNKEQKKELSEESLLDVIKKLQSSCDLFKLSRKEFERIQKIQLYKTSIFKLGLILRIMYDAYELNLLKNFDKNLNNVASSDDFLKLFEFFTEIIGHDLKETTNGFNKERPNRLSGLENFDRLTHDDLYARLEKILNSKVYTPPEGKDFVLDLVALHYYYSVPDKLDEKSKMLDLKFDEALFKLVMEWDEKGDQIKKNISETFRKHKSASTKKRYKEESKQKILSIYKNKLKEDPGWIKYTSRNKRALFIHEKLGKKVSEKTITRRLKEIEEKTEDKCHVCPKARHM